MAPQFNPPSWAKPNEHEYIGQAVGSLDKIFNAYQQAKNQGMNLGVSLAGQGIDPLRGASNPESVYGQLVARHKETRGQKSAESQAAVRKDEAQAGLYDAQANALGNAQVYVDPDSGRQILVPRGAKLIPRATKSSLSANPDLDAALNLYETAKEGLISGLSGSDTGPIMGRLPAFTSAQQIAKGSVAAMAPVLKQLFRIAGEGIFTDRDQQLLLDMIPTRTETPQARVAMIENIDKIVKAKLKTGARSTPQQSAPSGLSPQSTPAPRASGSDPLGLFR